MKKTITVIYSIFAFIVIIGSILWFVVSIRNDAAQTKQMLIHTIKKSAEKTVKMLNKNTGTYQNSALNKELRTLYARENAFQAILIQKNTEIVFVWPKNTDAFYQNEQKKIKIKHTPLFVTPVKIQLPLNSVTNNEYILYAALQTVSTTTLVNRGKTVFIIDLFLFLMTVIILALSYVPVQIPAFKRHTNQNDSINDVDEDNFDQNTTYQTEAFTEESIQTINEPIQPISFTENDEIPFSSEDEEIAVNGKLEDLEHLAIDTTQEKAVFDDTDKIYPSGIAPRNGNTEHRDNNSSRDMPDDREAALAKVVEKIDSSIKETASAGEDMTLLLIHTTDLSKKEDILHSMKTDYDQLNTFFVFDNDTVGLVIYYAALTHGMQIANALYDKLHSSLNSMGCYDRLTIGLTTRAGRLIPAHRMLNEASAALKKTWEEHTDNIVAFRVNPEKYRKFIVKNG